MPSGNANGGSGANTVLLKLNERAPILPANAGPEEIVMHRIDMKQAANELGIQNYTYGNLPAGSTTADITLGKRWLLSAYDDKSVRGMIATHGGPDGPSCWAWIGRNLLGGRDEQEILNNMLEGLTFDGTTTVLSFFSKFYTIAASLEPQLSQARLCTMYSSRFPAREYMAIMSSCDTHPGHTNFMGYATSVNNAIQTYHQRIQLHERRSNYASNAPVLYTANDGSGDDGYDAFEAFHTDSIPMEKRNENDLMANDVQDLANQLAEIIGAYVTLNGAKGRGARAPAANPRARPNPSGYKAKPPAAPRSNAPCTNCGRTGHMSRECKEPDAKCAHPICKSRGATRHLAKFCWFSNESACPEKLRPKIRKIKAEYDAKAKVAMLTPTCQDVDEYPEDFHEYLTAEDMNAIDVIEQPTEDPAQCGEGETPNLFDEILSLTDNHIAQLATYLQLTLHDRGTTVTNGEARKAVAEAILEHLSTTTTSASATSDVAHDVQTCDPATRYLSEQYAADTLYNTSTCNATAMQRMRMALELARDTPLPRVPSYADMLHAHLTTRRLVPDSPCTAYGQQVNWMCDKWAYGENQTHHEENSPHDPLDFDLVADAESDLPNDDERKLLGNNVTATCDTADAASLSWGAMMATAIGIPAPGHRHTWADLAEQEDEDDRVWCNDGTTTYIDCASHNKNERKRIYDYITPSTAHVHGPFSPPTSKSRKITTKNTQMVTRANNYKTYPADTTLDVHDANMLQEAPASGDPPPVDDTNVRWFTVMGNTHEGVYMARTPGQAYNIYERGEVDDATTTMWGYGEPGHLKAHAAWAAYARGQSQHGISPHATTDANGNTPEAPHTHQNVPLMDMVDANVLDTTAHHAYYAYNITKNTLTRTPNDALPSTLVVDTGASTHLENLTGDDGFCGARNPSKSAIQTGLTGFASVDYEGTHTQYLISDDLRVVELTRPAVLMLGKFRKALFSPAAALRDSGIRSYFNDNPHITLPDGTAIPVYATHGTYILPRWLRREEAERACDRLKRKEDVHVALQTAALPPLPPFPELGGDTHRDAKELGEHTYSTSMIPIIRAGQAILKWHARTGHASPKKLLHMPDCLKNAEELRGITRQQAVDIAGNSCTVCPKARMKATPHKRKKQGQEGHTAIEIRQFGDCVGVDLAGPYKPSYNGRFKYLAAFIDFRTNLGDVYFQKVKGYEESMPIRARYLASSRRFGDVKHFHSDMAPDLMGTAMIAWNEERGISASWNVAGESDMNNRTEGFIGRLSDTARALLIHAGVPEEHWPVAYLHACHILNRMPVYAHDDEKVTTAWERATGERPDARLLKVFGCVAHGLVRKKDRTSKLAPIATSGIFVGYSRHQPGGGVMIWVPNDTTERYHVVYSVKYDESRVYKDAWRNGREISTSYRGDEDDEATVDITPVAPERRIIHEPATPMSNPANAIVPASTMADEDSLQRVEMEVSNEQALTDATRNEQGEQAREAMTRSVTRRRLCNTPDPSTTGRSDGFGTACQLPYGHLGPHDWEATAPSGRPTRATHGAHKTDTTQLTLSASLASGTATKLCQLAEELDDLVIAGATPAGTDSTTFNEAMEQIHDTDDTEWDIKREVLHHGVYTVWHAHYLQGKFNAKKHVKRRKAKAKTCVIEDCMRHINVPNSIKEVLLHEFVDDFLDACETELTSHDTNKTWQLVPRTNDMNVVGSTWSFDIKRDMNNRILRFKARLCAQGFTQQKGIDYYRKYSHTVPLDVLRLLIAKCAMEGLELTEADYSTAYLNARLDTMVYMKQPPGFFALDRDGHELRGPNGEEMVCELDKAIYGLVQSGLMWEEEHHSMLKNRGWTQCEGEPCLFKKEFDGVTCYMCTYVDNLFMGFPPKSKHREGELRAINKRYKVNDLGPVEYTLGARVRQNTRTNCTTVDQEPYIDDIVAKWGADLPFSRAKTRVTPLTEAIYLSICGGEGDVNETPHWTTKCLQLGGKLNYLAVFTRPDISAALSMCMSHVSHATKTLYDALLHITSYVQQTKHYHLRYGAGMDAELRHHLLQHARDLHVDPWGDGDVVWMADASQGGEKPMQCNVGFIGGAPFSWKMGKMPWTTLSACEGEWFAQSAATAMIMSVKPIIHFMHIKATFPIISFCDNETAVKISNADYSVKRMKHVLTRMAYLNEAIKDGLVSLMYVSTSGNIADIGTKLLKPAQFHKLRQFLVKG